MTPAQAQVGRWRNDLVLFVREIFGADPDAWQLDVLRAVPLNIRVALKACKGPGKTCVLAWIGWWFLVCFPHPKAVATSITDDNLSDNLWTEFAKWQAKSPFLKRAFTWTATKIFAKDHPETWWISARNWPKQGDKTQQADSLAGVHADHVLFLIDEVGGIPDAVVATAEAGLANISEAEGRTAKLIIVGNPTHLEGPLYRACTRERHLWWVKEISSDPDDPNRTPRVSVEWARQQIEKYGAENPWVLVNVFGRFPPGQSNALIGVEEANDAANRKLARADYEEFEKILGVDVARFGDDTSELCPRQGRMCFKLKTFRNLRTTELGLQVAFSIDKWDPDATFIDQTGIGSGTVDKLHELHYPIIGIDGASSPLTALPKFLNRRAEMWWKMAEWIRTGGCIPNIAELITDLTGPTYKFDASGKIVVESKADMKKRGLQSPNKGDALALTFAAPVVKRPPRVPGALDRYSYDTEYDPFARSA